MRALVSGARVTSLFLVAVVFALVPAAVRAQCSPGCDDGLFCTIDTCDGATNTCTHLPLLCDDGLFCTMDMCDELTDTCASVPRCSNDGLFCNGGETCDEAADACLTSGPVTCDDGLFCTIDSCNEAINGCEHVPRCSDDGLFCNGGETCDEAADACLTSGPVTCDDGLFCTIDSCNELTDNCESTPRQCDDGLFCTPGAFCDEAADVCASLGPVCPDDGDPCNGVESCNEQTDTCQTGPPPPVCSQEPTPPGTDVIVTNGDVTTIFETVSGGGTTTVVGIDPATAGSLPAGGYTLPGLGIAYEISTTADVSGDITIGFVVPASVDLVTFNSLRVLHGENGVLVDRTYFSPAGCAPAPGSPCPAPNFATHTIFARVNSLSPFVLAALAAPSIQSITVPAAPVALGTAISVQAEFTDPGTHTAEWAWDDGTTSAGTVTESGGFGTVVGSHTYGQVGVYLVTLTVTDEDAFQGQSTSPYVVVYDPNGGFATGGGWITSPAGAYPADEELTGRASFGFVSKYATKNAAIPTGDTQFKFDVADFRFDSDSYEWMVISGAKARYRGVGRVNGSGSYGFELTAWDGQVSGGGGTDRIRVRVWDRNRGNAVVYDNQMNSADDANPTTALEGGSIVVRKK